MKVITNTGDTGQSEPVIEWQYKSIPRGEKEWLERVCGLAHYRGTLIDYNSQKDVEIMMLLLNFWEFKRPGELEKYKQRIKELRSVAKNKHVENEFDQRIIALMPVYLDMLIKAVWRDQDYSREFYKWFLGIFTSFKVPEGKI